MNAQCFCYPTIENCPVCEWAENVGLRNEVLACQSLLVDQLLAQSYDMPDPIVSYDDITNLYGDHEFSDKTPDEDGEIKCDICGYYFDADEAKDGDPGPCEENHQEPYEWWLVTGWLAGKLYSLGYVTLSDGQSHWWGRTTTGQRITLDGVLQEVARSIGVGQESEGAV